MPQILFLDVRPDPPPAAGVGGLILLAFLILFLSAIVLIGIFLIVKRIRRKHTRQVFPTTEAER